MTTLTLTAGVPPRDRLEQIGLWSLVGIVAAMQLSIAAAQILLTIAVAAWLASHLVRGERLAAPPFFWPLVVYAALTLVSAGFSLDPEVSFTDSKQLVLFMLVPLTYDFARGARANSVLSIVLTIGAASAFVGIVQYAVLNFDSLGQPAVRDVVSLDDLLGHADAGDLRAPRRGCCTARRDGCGPPS